jgi:hypothetical protein
MKGVRLFFLCAALSLSFSATAANEGLALQLVRDQQAEIRAGVIAKTGPYAKLDDSKRHELLDRQTRMLALIEGKQNASELTERDRTEVFNTLEWIEGTVNNTGDERLVCERTRKTGTNRLVRTCKTERQWREYREYTRRELERNRDGTH